MIGGTDITIPTKDSARSMELCVQLIVRKWPHAVIEDAHSGFLWPEHLRVPFMKPSELFVYRDSSIASKWHELGADPTLANTMIHLISQDNQLTLVVDDPNTPEIKSLLQSIRNLIETNSIKNGERSKDARP